MRLEYLLFRATILLKAVAFYFFQTLLQVTRLKVGATKIRSSAWLEHYTDNVEVTSSNLVGSTIVMLNVEWGFIQHLKYNIQNNLLGG